MQISSFVKRLSSRRKLPSELYVSIVASLYDDHRTLYFGFLAQFGAALLIALKDRDVVLGACTAAIGIVSLIRFADTVAYLRQRGRHLSVAEARKIELRYSWPATLAPLVFSVWAGLVLLRSSDPISSYIAIAALIGVGAGAAGRNFALPRLVALQIIAICGPFSIALVMHGDVYYIVLMALFVLLFVSQMSMGLRLNKTLVTALVAQRDVTQLASRFDTALSNMSHGLCMFDAKCRVLVANTRFTELFRISHDVAQMGASVWELLLDCVRVGTILGSNAEGFAEEFESHLLGGRAGTLTVETLDGRTLSLSFQPMENGGSVVVAEDITERRKAEARIAHLARYDELTGLPNRTSFRDEIERALNVMRRRHDDFAILFVDLDQFKEVNDTLGHPCGDKLLCTVAERLLKVVRDTDVVARFGGDEFVVLQASVRGPQEAAALAHRIIERLSQVYDIDGHQVIIGATIGIAMAPRDGDHADHLLKNADMALYRAKADARGTWSFFEQEMDTKAQARRNLEMDLRSALANEQFDVFYQPLLNLKTNRVSTCEALLRWPHPERGMISPAEFISVAEEMGLIVEIGNWVLRQACTEAMKWPRSVNVAVNLSPIQFRRGNVLAAIKDALAVSGLPAHRLEVEITESVLMQDTQSTRVAVEMIRDLGVRIALDDFGTGYSSLSYLHNFPLHKVKIDRSFLRGLGESERPLNLLRSVARLTADLGMSVAVEGVETAEQLAMIAAEKSIDEAQGFLFSKPRPASEIRPLLAGPSLLERKVA
jgi:diguanylate cyclase (GGDEF)-like protein